MYSLARQQARETNNARKLLLKIRFLSLFCFSIGLGSFLTAFVIPRWYTIEQIQPANSTSNKTESSTSSLKYGLFTACYFSAECIDVGWDITSSMLRPIFVARVLMLVELGILIVTVISNFYTICGQYTLNKHMVTSRGLLEIVSGVLVLLSLISLFVLFSTWKFNEGVEYRFDYCFYLATGSSAAFIASGSLSLYETKVKPKPSKQVYLVNYEYDDPAHDII